MPRMDVRMRSDASGWEWRVIDARGQLRLAGTDLTREQALETGSFWVMQVEDPEG